MSEWSEQELTLREAFGLDDAQLRWRRWCISANCAGNEDIFAQEYPATPEEAFLTSGRPVFNVKALNEAYGKAEEARQGALVRRGERVEFVPDEGRYLRMYEPVITGREYMIGIDVAAGYSGGDYSAMVVLDRDSFAVAAVWHGHIEPELLAEQAEMFFLT